MAFICGNEEGHVTIGPDVGARVCVCARRECCGDSGQVALIAGTEKIKLLL